MVAWVWIFNFQNEVLDFYILCDDFSQPEVDDKDTLKPHAIYCTTLLLIDDMGSGKSFYTTTCPLGWHGN